MIVEIVLIMAVFCLFFGGGIGYLVGYSVIEKVYRNANGFLQSDQFLAMDEGQRAAILYFFRVIFR